MPGPQKLYLNMYIKWEDIYTKQNSRTVLLSIKSVDTVMNSSLIYQFKQQIIIKGRELNIVGTLRRTCNFIIWISPYTHQITFYSNWNLVSPRVGSKQSHPSASVSHSWRYLFLPAWLLILILLYWKQIIKWHAWSTRRC